MFRKCLECQKDLPYLHPYAFCEKCQSNFGRSPQPGQVVSNLILAGCISTLFWVIIIILFVLFLFSCQTMRTLDPVETDKCVLVDKLGNVITDQVQKAFVCENRGAIKKDVVKKLYQFGLCKESQSSIQDLLCSLIAKESSTLLVKSVLPERWYCTGGEPAKAISKYVFSGCTSIFNK